MKKLLALAFSTAAFAFASSQNVCNQKAVEASISKNVKLSAGVTYSIITSRPFYNNLCEVAIEFKSKYSTSIATAYVSPDFVLSGDLYVNKHIESRVFAKYAQRLVTGSHLDELNRLPHITYKPQNYQNGKYVYFIGSMNAVHSRQAIKELVSLSNRYGYEIKILFYPLTDNGSAEAASFFCEHKTAQDYISGNFDRKNLCKDGIKDVNLLVNVLHKKFDVLATPVIITSDGNVYVGTEGISRLVKVMAKE